MPRVVSSQALSEPESGRGGNTTRDRILETARNLFAERGFSGVSTRELAASANVTERTLFRHFPTKVILFEVAVISPFQEYIATWLADWEGAPKGAGSPFDHALAFCQGLYRILEENRLLVMAMIAARSVNDGSGPEFVDELRSALSDLLDRMQEVMQVEAERRGWKVNPSIDVRLIFGLVLGVAVHGDLMFRDGEVPDRESMLHELATFVVYGLANRPEQPKPIRARRSKS